MIEEVRGSERNPKMPPWLRDAYKAAWRELIELALRDLLLATDAALVCSAIAVIAFGKGQRALGEMAMLTEDEREEMLDMERSLLAGVKRTFE